MLLLIMEQLCNHVITEHHGNIFLSCRLHSPTSVTSSEGFTHAAGIMLTLMQQEDTDNTG